MKLVTQLETENNCLLVDCCNKMLILIKTPLSRSTAIFCAFTNALKVLTIDFQVTEGMQPLRAQQCLISFYSVVVLLLLLSSWLRHIVTVALQIQVPCMLPQHKLKALSKPLKTLLSDLRYGGLPMYNLNMICTALQQCCAKERNVHRAWLTMRLGLCTMTSAVDELD